MAFRSLWPLLILVACTASALEADAQIVLETRDLRLEIGADARLKSLTARTSGTDYLAPEPPAPAAVVYRGGRTAVDSQETFAENEAPVYRGGQALPATEASRVGDRLVLRFAQANVTATYQVIEKPDYLALRLASLEGDPIDRIDLLRLRVKRLPCLGPWIDVAYDDRFGLCLCGGNVRTNAGMREGPNSVEMMAVAEKDPGFVGATAVLFGCPSPRERFLDAMEVVERDFGLPAGARNRRSPGQTDSYLWCRPTPQNVQDYIRLAKRAGFRTILYSYNAFSQGAGHFLWNDHFPRGMADLKAVADAIRAAGLKVGLHLHYSKAVKTDPYVTPVPDERFHKLRSFTLAAELDERTAVLSVREDPAGCPRAKGRRVLKIGKELVAYRDFTAGPAFQFTGCERGHLKTAAVPHPAGQRVELLDVDDWDIFIRFDQRTEIQDEVARRIAAIFRETGPYDVVYFDGAEDVHDPYWYHVAAAQYRVFRLLEPQPPVCEAAMSGHFSWHMMTRGNAYDVPGDHIKTFCREISCRTAPVRAREFTRINFGWIFSLYKDLGPDALEYVLSRGAAWDCPFSMIIDPRQVAENPRGEDCLDVIKVWEDARIGNRLTPAQRESLKTLDPKEHRFVKTWHAVFLEPTVKAWREGKFADQEHHLFVNEKGDYELVPIRPLPGVPAGIRAYTFQRSGQPGDTWVLAWALGTSQDLRFPATAPQVKAMRPFGTFLPVRVAGGDSMVPIGGRTYLRFAGMSPAQATEMMAKARP